MVTIQFKSFESYKQTLESINFNPDRIRPDRFHTVNVRGFVTRIYQLDMAGKVLFEYRMTSDDDMKADDPWLEANEEKQISKSIEVRNVTN